MRGRRPGGEAVRGLPAGPVRVRPPDPRRGGAAVRAEHRGGLLPAGGVHLGADGGDGGADGGHRGAPGEKAVPPPPGHVDDDRHPGGRSGEPHRPGAAGVRGGHVQLSVYALPGVQRGGHSGGGGRDRLRRLLPAAPRPGERPEGGGRP